MSEISANCAMLMPVIDIMPQPVLLVAGGMVQYLNRPAAGLFPQTKPGDNIGTILSEASEFYSKESGENLFSSCFEKDKNSYEFTIRRLDAFDIIVFNPMQNTIYLSPESIGAISDRIRGPITTMFSVSSLLFPALEELEDKKVSSQVAMLNKSFYRLLRLSGNIFDASNMISEKTVLYAENTNLTDLLNSLYVKVRPLCAAASVEFEYQRPRDDIFAAVDRQKIERAILNLISNSLKATPEGGKITLKLMVVGKNIHIKVNDTGSGIPTEILSTVFTRFNQHSHQDMPSTGLGLGLPLVRHIVSLHGGNVALEGYPGRGTNVTISIPLTLIKENVLKTPLTNYDYTGGFSHELVELSDSMPIGVFESDNIN